MQDGALVDIAAGSLAMQGMLALPPHARGCGIAHAGAGRDAAGDHVDDYAVDPAFRAVPADAAQAAWSARRMGALCAELGTALDTSSLPWTITPEG